MPEMTIGDRLRQIRRRANMTQDELAERSGISKEVIAKLEQNRRTTARVPTLHAFARALDVETADFLGSGVELDSNDNGDAAQLLTLRRALMPSPGADDTDLAIPDFGTVRRQVTAATLAYKNCQFRTALGHLAALLPGAEAAAVAGRGGDAERERWLGLLADAYVTATRTLVTLRHEDLAYAAVHRSLNLSEESGNSFLRAVCGENLSWILIRQTRFGEAERTATFLAEPIEPRLGRSDTVRLAAWGRLHLWAAAAAGRNNRPGHATEYLVKAGAAADLGVPGQPSYQPFQALFNKTSVRVAEVELATVQGDPERALRLAHAIPRVGRSWDAVWARHILDVAEAEIATGRYTDALATLMRAYDAKPGWTKEQRLARRLALDLSDELPVRRAREAGLSQLTHFDIRT